jgi:hypothetical protein
MPSPKWFFIIWTAPLKFHIKGNIKIRLQVPNRQGRKMKSVTVRNVVLVDIDHTISAAWHRDHMIGATSWDEYHEKAIHDDPIDDIVDLIWCLRDSKYDVVAITSRPEKWRKLTIDWLVDNAINIDELLMRPDDDFTPSPESKLNLAKSRFPTFENILFLLEDRQDICDVFEKEGITVLQVRARQKK